MLRVDIVGLEDAGDLLRHLPETVSQASSLAINQVATRSGMKSITEEMYSEVNFPSGYLKGDRIGVTKFAKPADLEAIIKARKRATSLARFAPKGAPIGGRPGTLRIKVATKGGSATLQNAFLVRLRKGASKSEDNYNVGLAMYVKKGQSISGKRSTHTAWLNPTKTLALLYGPSVDQVFRDVREKSSGDILAGLEAEFNRQLSRLLA